MTDTIPRTSPFRGPRSFQIGDRLYGRDREARDLLSTLIAERIVLLNSPSGAGKTSLVQAALIPMLEDREFTVLPVMRVNADAGGSSANRYLRSAILSLEEGFSAEEQLPAAELESLDLAAYLKRRVPPDQDALLIFDQFEEVLTLDPTDIAAKHAFFDAVGRALRERRFWALFAMREDYVAALEPYLRHMPNRLNVRFRLDLLSVEGARQALREPPREVGVTFEESAVNRLIDDLRRVNVQRPDGTIEEQLGPHVEPVQLQVLGLRIWSGLAPDATVITNEDVTAAGDVNQALGDYYADCLKAVAVNGVSERAVRTWFDRELITPQGVRGQVLQGQGTSAGLENTAIRELVDAYLVRAEPRRGATWFELAHDRLIAPVRAGNTAWFEANLSTLQRQADLWDRQGRPNGLLLRGDTLQEAERWAAAHHAALTSVEQDFLELCRQAQRQARRIRNLAIGATVLAIAASLAFVTALWFFNRAEEQRLLAEQNARLSRSRELAAAAVSSLSNDPQRSLLLSLAAIETTQAAGEPVTPESQQALYRAVQANRLTAELIGHEAGLRAVAYSPDGATIATTGADGTIRLWNAADGRAVAVLEGHADQVYTLAFSPDGALLASAGFEGEVIFWDVAPQEEEFRISLGDVTINDLAFSPDGALLAAAIVEDGTLAIFDANDGSAVASVVVDPDYSIDTVAFSPDGTQIATGGGDYLTRIWDFAALLADSDAAEPLLTLAGPIDEINDLAFSPDGTALAVASLELRVFLWDTAEGTLLNTLQGHAGAVYSVEFNAAGDLLATGSSDGTAKIWRLDTGQPLLTLAGHSDFVYDAAFSPDGQHLATAGIDGSGRIWSLAFAPPDGTLAVAANPAGDLLATIGNAELRLWNATSGATLAVLPGSDDGFSAVAFSPDGATLAVGDNAGVIGLYSVADLLAAPESVPELELIGPEDAIGRLRFSPDGNRLAGASNDYTVRVWDVASGEEMLLLEGLSDWVYGLAFSPDGSRIAAGDQLGLLIIWDSDGNEVTQIDVGEPVNALAYSPDGAILAVASDGVLVYRYSADDQALESLDHGAPTYDLAYTANGELFTAGGDGRIVRWTGETAVFAIPAPASAFALVLLPNERMASVGADGVLYVHELMLENLRSVAQQQLVREPTEGECVAYQLVEGCE